MFWDILQYIGLGASFLYLWLEFRQKTLMWVISACCSAIYAAVYCHAQIYGDMGFSLFNICMCGYGLWKWKRKVPVQHAAPKSQEILYRHFRWGEFGVVMLCTAAIWAALFLLLKYPLHSPVPALDAFTTTLNIVGTWVLAQKIIEVWGYWFLVNLVSIYLYAKRGLHLTTILLYSFYLCASVYGYLKWRIKGHLTSSPNHP